MKSAIYYDATVSAAVFESDNLNKKGKVGLCNVTIGRVKETLRL